MQGGANTNAGNYQQLLDVIQQQWQTLRVTASEQSADTHIVLPNDFIAPSVNPHDNFVFKDQFYWDTYFTITEVIEFDFALAKGMVDNLLFLLSQLGYVPNSNNHVHLGRSQPPLLSEMVRLVYEFWPNQSLSVEQQKREAWLADAAELVIFELESFWYASERTVFDGLARYSHENSSHRGAEDESGWDYTNRFDSRARDFLAIDLNCFLYQAEQNIAYFATQLGWNEQIASWRWRAEQRREQVSTLLWEEQAGLFFDYDFRRKQLGSVVSLASLVPLFTGVASDEQAKKLVEKLALFETEHGLSTTALADEPIEKTQWMHPNGWAPLHYMVVLGLQRYGYEKEAKRIATKWVQTVQARYGKTGQLEEKYNMLDPMQEPTSAVYPDQHGFAWTNAVTARFIYGILRV